MHEAIISFAALLNATAAMPEEELLHFSSRLKWEFIRRDQVFSAGVDSARIAYVHSGLFKLVQLTGSDREYIYGFSGPKALIGDYTAALTEVRPTMIITALEDSEVLSFDYRDFKAMYTRHACWQEVGRKFAERYYLVQENKAKILATASAKERLQCFYACDEEVTRRIPKKDIAVYLGMTPVSLSRLIGSI